MQGCRPPFSLLLSYPLPILSPISISPFISISLLSSSFHLPSPFFPRPPSFLPSHPLPPYHTPFPTCQDEIWISESGLSLTVCGLLLMWFLLLASIDVLVNKSLYWQICWWCIIYWHYLYFILSASFSEHVNLLKIHFLGYVNLGC